MRWQKLTPNLMVEDVAASAAWFVAVLGFALGGEVPGEDGVLNFAMLHRDDVPLMLQRRGSLEADVPALAGVPVGASLTFFINVDDVTALYEPIRDRVETVVPLHDTWYGQREVYIRDLNGYIFCLAQAVAQA
ncbi:MAG: VOC family protein [Anaerolineae bacterium]|nr:VOC family protein [Anaerolineae bacterium]